MKINQMIMMNLVAISLIMSVMLMGTNGQDKPKGCCTLVSNATLTSPITGFTIQHRNPPCVRAVIFNTTEGPRCMYAKLRWVKEKVKELIKLQNLNMKMNSTVSRPLTASSS